MDGRCGRGSHTPWRTQRLGGHQPTDDGRNSSRSNYTRSRRDLRRARRIGEQRIGHNRHWGTATCWSLHGQAVRGVDTTRSGGGGGGGRFWLVGAARGYLRADGERGLGNGGRGVGGDGSWGE